MFSLRSVLAATAVTFALGAPAFAQNISLELSDRLGTQAITVDKAASVSRLKSNRHVVMQHVGRIETSIIYRSNGPSYATVDGREQLVRTF
jgi:hypothetical protein